MANNSNTPNVKASEPEVQADPAVQPDELIKVELVYKMVRIDVLIVHPNPVIRDYGKRLYDFLHASSKSWPGSKSLEAARWLKSHITEKLIPDGMKLVWKSEDKERLGKRQPFDVAFTRLQVLDLIDHMIQADVHVEAFWNVVCPPPAIEASAPVILDENVTLDI